MHARNPIYDEHARVYARLCVRVLGVPISNKSVPSLRFYSSYFRTWNEYKMDFL